MDQNLNVYWQSLIAQEDILSVMHVAKQNTPSPFLDGANHLFLVIVNRADPRWEARHFLLQDERIVEHRISQWQIENWAMHGADERVSFWLQHAEIMLDRNGYMAANKERLLYLPSQVQKQRVYEEYSSCLRHYLEAKELLQHGYELDAYQAILHALQGLARLVILEGGHQPLPGLWVQVKQIDPSVYKLYEELTASHEPLGKRIELLLLPLEFHLMSKMKDCTQPLLDVLQSRNRPWLVKELLQQPALAASHVDLHVLLEKMAKKTIVHEVLFLNEEKAVYEKGYQLSG